MPPEAQRAITVALGVAVVVLGVLLAMKSAPHSDATSTGDAAMVVVDAGAVIDAAIAIDVSDDAPAADAGVLRLADGTVVPPLGPKAPKQVRFGVVLVVYDGAQGAPMKARNVNDALALATKLAVLAKTDFAGAVQGGDNGSATDLGVVDRKILEPTSEAVLFALPVGGTSGVIDTPRGFWIVKRLE